LKRGIRLKVDKKSFGEVLKGIRNDRGITQRELAKLVGVDFTYISKIEHDSQVLSEDKLLAIEVALGVKKYSFVLLSGRIPTDFKTVILLDAGLQDYINQRVKNEV
jgi:transcriptional regulator with XRE-family HTH domain